MRKIPVSYTVAKEIDFVSVLIGLASLAGAIIVLVLFPGIYRNTRIPELIFMLVMIGNAVVLFLLRAGFRKYCEKYGPAQDTKVTEETK